MLVISMLNVLLSERTAEQEKSEKREKRNDPATKWGPRLLRFLTGEVPAAGGKTPGK